MTAATLLIPIVVAAASPASPGQGAGSSGTLPADAPAVTQACVGCHGARGEGNPAVGAPRLAAQSAHYLAKQLRSYANGSRRDPVMEPIAKDLPPQAVNEVAAYYAQSDAPLVRAEGGKPEPPERGRVLAVQGDNALGVQACGNCHGPGGVGEPPTIPYIAGLHADYISAELNDWKEGTRRNDAGQQMATVAQPLSAADIEAVAQYYAALPPPKPAPLHLVQAPAGPKPKPPAASARVTGEPAQPAGRVGVEQGAPTTGGTEGPGGSGESEAENGAAAAGDGSAARRGADAAKEGAAGATPWPRVRQPSESDSAPAAGDPAERGDPARGRAIVASGAYGCPGCHTIPGIRWPQGIVGPPLHGIASRAFIAGQLPNNPGTLTAFLINPPALVPETGMPAVGLTPAEARHVAAFLQTLELSDGR